ncbi:unnamed protein product, partial [marine sediment metagenome]
MTTKSIIPQLNKASTVANGVGKLERLAERATEADRAYTKEGTTIEAGSPSSILGARAPSQPGGKKSYKESHAKSHNYTQNTVVMLTRRGGICRGKICRWAKCQKTIRSKCPAYLWVVAEYERLRLAGGCSDTFGRVKSDTKVAPPKDTRYDDRAEYRDFLRELGRGSRYVGFGKEADNCGRWGMLKECDHGHNVLKR